MTKSRFWLITFWHGSARFAEIVEEHKERVRYACWQDEVCPESGREHVQAYIELRNPDRFTGIKRKFGDDSHVERRQGSREQARDYCRKAETRKEGVEPFEFGEWKINPGKRNDLEAIREKLDAGEDESAIADEHFGEWCRYRKAFSAYRNLKRERRNWQMEVFVYWGDPGTGKTRKVYASEKFEDIYELSGTNVTGGAIWFDGYCGEPVLLIDDFYGWIKLSFLLRLLDRYPLRLPIKGGFSECGFRRVYITSNKHMDEWYDWCKFGERMKGALERRITTTTKFTDIGAIED
jgi:hypothetical protein